MPTEDQLHLGDSGRIRQILLNLLGNAVKFTSEGRVAISVRTNADGNRDQVSIAITDSGIGIAADRIDQVFDSFTQADTTISRQFGGTGLGLTISRLLAQQMGGDIGVTSELGKGSVFTLVLHLPRTIQLPKISPYINTAPMTKLRLLVAEDNRTNMLVTRKLLERSVASIEEAVNGRLAVTAYCRA